MSKRTITLLLIASVMLTATVLTARPAVIMFHRWRFDTLNDYVTNGPTTVDTNGLAYIDVTEAGPAHAYHMRRLVELGVISKIEYVMTNLLGKSPERSSFFKKLLAQDCPNHLFWSSEEPTQPTPTVFMVWCEHENREDWIVFLETENRRAETAQE